MGRTMMLFLDPKVRQHKKSQKQIEGTFLLVKNRVIADDEIGDYCNDCFEPLSYHDEYDACYCESCMHGEKRLAQIQHVNIVN